MSTGHSASNYQTTIASCSRFMSNDYSSQSGLDHSLPQVLSGEEPKEGIKHVVKSLGHSLIVLQFALHIHIHTQRERVVTNAQLYARGR